MSMAGWGGELVELVSLPGPFPEELATGEERRLVINTPNLLAVFGCPIVPPVGPGGVPLATDAAGSSAPVAAAAAGQPSLPHHYTSSSLGGSGGPMTAPPLLLPSASISLPASAGHPERGGGGHVHISHGAWITGSVGLGDIGYVSGFEVDTLVERYERACSAAGAKSVHQYWADRYAADPSGGVHGGAPAEGNKNLCEHRRHRLDPVAFVRLVTSLSNITDHDALELFDIFDVEGSRVIRFKEFHLLVLFLMSYHCMHVAKFIQDFGAGLYDLLVAQEHGSKDLGDGDDIDSARSTGSAPAPAPPVLATAGSDVKRAGPLSSSSKLLPAAAAAPAVAPTVGLGGAKPHGSTLALAAGGAAAAATTAVGTGVAWAPASLKGLSVERFKSLGRLFGLGEPQLLKTLETHGVHYLSRVTSEEFITMYTDMYEEWDWWRHGEPAMATVPDEGVAGGASDGCCGSSSCCVVL